MSGTVVALAARFGISAGALWRDEVHTLNLATRPRYGDMLATLHLDSAPALYPTLLRLWMAPAWEEPDAGARLLGFVVAGAAVLALWGIGRALVAGVPLLMLAYFALQGATIQTLSGVKPYGVATVLAMAAIAAIASVALRPSSRAAVVAIVLAVLAANAAYQNVALVLAAAVATVVAARERRRAVVALGIAGAAAIAVVPYAGVLAGSLQWRELTRWDVPVTALVSAMWRSFASNSVWALALWVAAGAVAIALAAREVVRGDSSRRATLGTALATAVIVFGIALMVASGRPPHPWHWVGILGTAALALDLALASVPWARRVRVVLAVGAAVALLPSAITLSGVRQTNVDRIARFVSRTADAQDLVVVVPWFYGISFARYYDGRAPWMTVPPLEDLAVHRFDLVKARMAAAEPLAPLHARIVTTLRSGRRVWLVGSPAFVPPGTPPPVLPPAPALPTGWNETPYTIGWAQQTGYLLQRVGLVSHIVTVPPAEPVQAIETVQLIVVAGMAPGTMR